MSLDVVQAKLSAQQYAGAVEFVKDVLLIFSNATLYNDKSSKIAEASLQLDALFKSECAKASSLSAACISAAAAAHEEPRSQRKEQAQGGPENDLNDRPLPLLLDIHAHANRVQNGQTNDDADDDVDGPD
jgi:hypothetical protein